MAEEENKGVPAQENPSSDPSNQQADIDRLRSIKDREISQLQATVQGLQQQLQQLQTPAEVAGILGQLREVDALLESNPLEAAKKYRQAVQNLGAGLVQERRFRQAVDAEAKIGWSTAYALEIASEHGGDWKEYRDELNKAKTKAEMETLREKIDTRLLKDKLEKGSRQSKPVDNGRGSAAPGSAAQVRAKLNSPDYDVTTPEGREKFLRDSASLKKEINALSR